MGRNSDIDREISQAASRQHGNVTRAQLLAAGLDDDAIAWRVRKGRLHRVHRSVYAVGRPARMPLERAAAAVLACGPHAALSHRSALVLWGIWKIWPNKPMHVSVTAGDRRPKGITVHRPAGLHRRDVRTTLGIRVTSPARTMLDMTADLTGKQLARAINTARLARILTPGQLAEVVTRNPLHPGAARLEPHTDATKAPTRSEWERDFPDFCERYGLPQPVLNTELHGYEIDVLFAEERLIVELDGWDFHQTREAFELDRERDAHALEHGLATVRVTKDRVDETPDREAARLHRILESRRAA